MTSFFSTLSVLEVGSAIALLSLLVPILIHLFNPSRGKVVWVGNISLIKTAIHKKVIEVKITQFLLLLVRLLILLILCLLLMQLVQQRAIELTDRTRVLLHPNWIQTSSDDEILEALTHNKNNEFVLLTPTFPKIKPSTVAAIRELAGEYSEPTGASPLSLQSLLSELDNRADWSLNNIVYVTNQQYLFNDRAIEVKQDYAWHIKSLGDEQIDQLKNNNKLEDTQVDIYFDSTRQLDVQYLSLVLEYWQKQNDSAIKIDLFPLADKSITWNEGKVNGQPHWVFWLADQKLPQVLLDKAKLGSSIFEDVNLDDSKHPHTNVTETRRSEANLVSIAQREFQFFQYNQHQYLESGYSPVYNTIDGIVVLQLKNIGDGVHYRFGSRINPQWNDWIVDNEFPYQLAHLLNHDIEDETKLLDKQQIVRLFDYAPQILSSYTSLASWLVLLLSGLWLLETVMSNSRKRLR